MANMRLMATGTKKETKMYNLNTEIGTKLNGTTWNDRDEMLAAVKAQYGTCYFGVTEGSIVADDELIATFGEA